MTDGQAEINAAQAETNAAQAETNAAQDETNVAHDETNVTQRDAASVQASLSEQLISALDDVVAGAQSVRSEVRLLHEEMTNERATRKSQVRLTRWLVTGTVAALVASLLVGGVLVNQLRIESHRRCVVSRNTRAALKESLIDLVVFAVAAPNKRTPAEEKAIQQFVVDYRARINKKIPALIC